MLKYNKYLSVVPIGTTWTCFKFSFHLINGEEGSLSEHGTKKKKKTRTTGLGERHQDTCKLKGKRQEITKHAAANQHARGVLP